ncbi:hedgehog signaling/DD-peptidase zinc-binding domain protein [Vibrio phage 1.275.O._10N.286.54.E11]|nr:hedgehog signaling/DD-peptidase zinc-binding domain protein [Vibrio phage 1.275.O._10N.286.54.E11]
MEYHRFSKSSLKRMESLDPELRKVVKLALKYSKYDFGVSESLRTLERQKELVASGKSKTMNSRHLPNAEGKSEAVDLTVYVNGKLTWEKKHLRKVSGAMFRAAFELGVPIEWGGHWETFLDMPHYQKAGGF